MMGAHVLEQSRLHGVDKLVVLGTVCAYPKFTPVPFSEDDLWNGYPEETNAPYGVAKKSLLVGGAGLPRAVRAERDLPAAGEPLRPARQLPPDERARDPGPDPQDDDAQARGEREVVLWGDGSPTREFLYVDDAAEGLVLAARALRRRRARQPRHGRGDLDPRPRRADRARLTGFEGEIVWDTTKPNGQPRRKLDTSRAKELFGFEAKTPLREGIERTVAWYREHAAAYAGR